jgi:glycosyltransferase involved in cell wall biosynthesis
MRPFANRAGPMTEPTYSFVIPLYNEEGVLPELHRRLAAVAAELDGPAEFILVDDGSADRTREIAERLRADDERVKLVSLSRNFGHQLAISAGLDFASGDAVVIMDGDLQDPPEVVPEMAQRWRDGYDVVYAVRAARAGETRFKRGTATLFYRLMSKLTSIEIPRDAGDFRLVDRRVASIVANMREPDRYLRGMFAWVGFRQTAVPYERDARAAGEGKYSIGKMLRFAVDGLISFSTAPLRLTLASGFAIAGLAFAAGIAAIVLKLADSSFTPPGWASLIVVLSFFSGIQLIVLGTIGLYVGRIYAQGKQRPLYLVSRAVGFDRPTAEVGDRERLSRESQPG